MHQGAKILIVFNDHAEQGGIEIKTKLRGHFRQYKNEEGVQCFFFVSFFQQQNLQTAQFSIKLNSTLLG